MTRSIIYCDDLGDPISKDEFDLLDNHSIIYIQDGEKQKIEYYEGRKMFNVTYYLSDGENITDAFNRFNPERNRYDKEFVSIIKKIKWHNYHIEEVNSFTNKKLDSISKNLYDDLGREICEQAYDINTGKPFLGSTKKYYYDKQDDIKSLWLDYDSNGGLGLITGEWVENTDRGWKGYMKGEDTLAHYFPGFLEGCPYYRNANFLPDTGQLNEGYL